LVGVVQPRFGSQGPVRNLLFKKNPANSSVIFD